MAQEFSTLETNILKAKGLTGAQLTLLSEAGIGSRGDLQTVGDAATLTELVAGIDAETAAKVIQWATGRAVETKAAPPSPAANVVLESADIVHCVHCGAKQPKDYKSGDLCLACGRQAEPILSCYWCSGSGPGKFCRSCGAEFIPTAELDLGVLLRREGLSKDEIPKRLRAMDAGEKDSLWGRVRKQRG
ncbi:MAG: hypothetical protein ABJF23_05650 [Bryobacteraceae bacterium]